MTGASTLVVDDPSQLVNRANGNYDKAVTSFKKAFAQAVAGVLESYFTSVELTLAPRRLTELRYLSGQVNVAYTIVFPPSVPAVPAETVANANETLKDQLNTELESQGIPVNVTGAVLESPTIQVITTTETQTTTLTTTTQGNGNAGSTAGSTGNNVPSGSGNASGATAVDLTFITIVIAVAVAMSIS